MRKRSSWNKGKKMPFIHRVMKDGFLPVMAFIKGNIPWNKGIIGTYLENEKNSQWRGDEVGYYALHDWVRRRFHKNMLCEICGADDKKVYHLANKSGEYKRDLSDWMRLCVSCHKKYDLHRKNR